MSLCTTFVFSFLLTALINKQNDKFSKSATNKSFWTGLRLLRPTVHLCVHVSIYTWCIYCTIHLHVKKQREIKETTHSTELSSLRSPQQLAMQKNPCKKKKTWTAGQLWFWDRLAWSATNELDDWSEEKKNTHTEKKTVTTTEISEVVKSEHPYKSRKAQKWWDCSKGHAGQCYATGKQDRCGCRTALKFSQKGGPDPRLQTMNRSDSLSQGQWMFGCPLIFLCTSLLCTLEALLSID